MEAIAINLIRYGIKFIRNTFNDYIYMCVDAMGERSIFRGLAYSRVSLTYCSIVKSFSNFTQGTALSLPSFRRLSYIAIASSDILLIDNQMEELKALLGTILAFRLLRTVSNELPMLLRFI